MTMKWRLAFLLFFTLALLPFLLHSQEGNGAQQAQPASTVTNSAPGTETTAPNPSAPPAQSTSQAQQSMRDHFRSCDKALNQARDQVRTLSHDARQHFSYDREALRRQHLQVQDEMQALKTSHEQFVSDLNTEQRNSIQDHVESMQQMHDRIQAHLQTIDQEFTGTNLHLDVVAEEAKAAERDMKSYQKHLQETGKTFNLLSE